MTLHIQVKKVKAKLHTEEAIGESGEETFPSTGRNLEQNQTKWTRPSEGEEGVERRGDGERDRGEIERETEKGDGERGDTENRQNFLQQFNQIVHQDM